MTMGTGTGTPRGSMGMFSSHDGNMGTGTPRGSMSMGNGDGGEGVAKAKPLSVQEKGILVDAFVKSKDEITTYFYVPRIQLMLEEILGLLVCPILLLVYLPRASLDICNFIRNTLYESDHLGDWCSLGCFEVGKTDPRLSR